MTLNGKSLAYGIVLLGLIVLTAVFFVIVYTLTSDVPEQPKNVSNEREGVRFNDNKESGDAEAVYILNPIVEELFKTQYVSEKYLEVGTTGDFNYLTIRIEYNESELGDIPEELLEIFRWNNETMKWELPGHSYVNTRDNAITTLSKKSGIFTIRGTFGGCLIKESVDDRDECFIGWARYRKIANICEWVEPFKRVDCYGALLNTTGGVDLCDLIDNESTKDYCLSALALYKNEPTLCKELAEDEVRQMCFFNFLLNNQRTDVCPYLEDEKFKAACEELSLSMDHIKQHSPPEEPKAIHTATS